MSIEKKCPAYDYVFKWRCLSNTLLPATLWFNKVTILPVLLYRSVVRIIILSSIAYFTESISNRQHTWAIKTFFPEFNNHLWSTQQTLVYMAQKTTLQSSSTDGVIQLLPRTTKVEFSGVYKCGEVIGSVKVNQSEGWMYLRYRYMCSQPR